MDNNNSNKPLFPIQMNMIGFLNINHRYEKNTFIKGDFSYLDLINEHLVS